MYIFISDIPVKMCCSSYHLSGQDIYRVSSKGTLC